jgi:hypothetical protein
MLAILYLILMVALGYYVCRRFYWFISLQHRMAASFLVGLLLSTWITYIGASAFAWSPKPLIWGNAIFFSIAAIVIYKLKDHSPIGSNALLVRPEGASKWDWLVIVACLVMVSWLMFATFDEENGKLLIGHKVWSDFGPNLSLIQSFIQGHNFPTEYPHFPGDSIRYHFLFWFQAGNLGFLGLKPNWSLNLLSIFSITSMLILVMALGEVLFNSRIPGRIATLLFFFHGSFSYIEFFKSYSSFNEALDAIYSLNSFIPSGYPFRGESWGVWSQAVFINQRHLTSGIGILCLVFIYLTAIIRNDRGTVPIMEPEKEETLDGEEEKEIAVDRELSIDEEINRDVGMEEIANTEIEIENRVDTFVYREQIQNIEDVDVDINEATEIEGEQENEIDRPKRSFNIEDIKERVVRFATPTSSTLPTLIFSGVLIGLLPMWNGAVYIAALAVLGTLFILSRLKVDVLYVILAAFIIGLPQIMLLRPEQSVAAQQNFPAFHWGFIVENPTLISVIKYLGFTFGFKWILIFIALYFLRNFHRLIFLVFTSLLGVAFFIQLSEEVLANHKFINIWLIFANLFVGYGALQLWKYWIPGKLITVIIILAILPGGIIDLFPIYNDSNVQMAFQRDDPLINWLRTSTNPKDIFLSDTYVNHPILIAGRRIYFGHTYYAWSAGHDVASRDALYRQMLGETDFKRLVELLQDNNIAYVAIDDGLRSKENSPLTNEELYKKRFRAVFKDYSNQYNSLTIYKVPKCDLITQESSNSTGDLID